MKRRRNRLRRLGSGPAGRRAGTAGLRRQTRAIGPASARSGPSGSEFGEGNDTDGRHRNLDTITVTPTKTEQSVVDTMAGTSVVTGAQINREQPNSIADMLQNVPGVTSEVTPNDPGQSINVRGMQDFGRVQHPDRWSAAGLPDLRPQRERHVLSRSAIRQPGRRRPRTRVEYLWIGRDWRRRVVPHDGCRRRPQAG